MSKYPQHKQEPLLFLLGGRERRHGRGTTKRRKKVGERFLEANLFSLDEGENLRKGKGEERCYHLLGTKRVLFFLRKTGGSLEWLLYI